MQIESLRALELLASCQSFTRAARMLNITQPALSNRIATIEREIGFELFARTKPLRPTAQGERFLKCAHEILRTYDEGLRDCRKLGSSPEPVRLLWMELTSHYSRLLADSKDIPRVMAQPTGNESPLAMLSDERVDIVANCWVDKETPEGKRLASSMRALGIEALETGTTRGAIAMSKSNPRAKHEALTSRDLRGCCILIPSAAVFDQMRSVLTEMLGDDLDIQYSLGPIFGNLHNMGSYDLSTDAICTGKTIIRQNLGGDDQYAVYDEIDGKPILFPLALYYRRDEHNPNAREFIDRARKVFASEADGAGGTSEAGSVNGAGSADIIAHARRR